MSTNTAPSSRRPSIDLPDKPSALIRVGLEDLALCEAASPRFKIMMSTWRVESPALETCFVCLAGAVMAQRGRLTNDLSPSENALLPTDYPWSYNEQTERKLRALNDLREGRITVALTEFYGHDNTPHVSADYRDIRSYHVNPAGFRTDMENLATYLESFNL